MSFGCSSKALEKLLNTKKFQKRIINSQRVRLKISTNVTKKMIHKR